MSTISERIVEIASEKEKNNAEFCKKMNVNPTYVSTLSKRPDAVPNDIFIKTLCDKYSINEEWLRNGIGAKYRDTSFEIEIAKITSTLFCDNDYTFRRKLVSLICNLSVDQIKLLEEMAKQLLLEN